MIAQPRIGHDAARAADAHHNGADAGRPTYVTRLAETDAEVRAAQHLRYRVFAEEMGARLAGAESGLDCDRFDAYCDHLLVCSVPSGRVVGTYRMLSCNRAQQAGGFYAATEFDVRRLAVLGSRVLEVGRACVDPDHRDGVVIALLWAGLLEYIGAREYEYVIGCGSNSLADHDGSGARTCNRLGRERRAPEAWRVFPYRPFPLDPSAGDDALALPPLMKGYLRLGALVCGDPAWDLQFRTADFLLLLPMAHMNPRYALGLRRRSGRGRR